MTGFCALWVSAVIRDGPDGIVRGVEVLPYDDELSDDELFQPTKFAGLKTLLSPSGERMEADVSLGACIVEGDPHINYSCDPSTWTIEPPFLIYSGIELVPIYDAAVSVVVHSDRMTRYFRCLGRRKCEIAVRAPNREWFGILRRWRSGCFWRKIHWHLSAFAVPGVVFEPGMVELAGGVPGVLGSIEVDPATDERLA